MQAISFLNHIQKLKQDKYFSKLEYHAEEADDDEDGAAWDGDFFPVKCVATVANNADIVVYGTGGEPFILEPGDLVEILATEERAYPTGCVVTHAAVQDTSFLHKRHIQFASVRGLKPRFRRNGR